MVPAGVLGRFGAGGPAVDTVLADPVIRPGASLRGEVTVVGGSTDLTVEQVTVGLVARVDVSAADPDDGASVEFHRAAVAGTFLLAAGATHRWPFEVAVPWETPITEVRDRPLPGMAVGVRTRLTVVHAVDVDDLAAVRVAPPAVHERLLVAFTRLGFSFRDARIRDGRIPGVAHGLPFHQEVAFQPTRAYPGGLAEVGVTVVPGPTGAEVVLGVDRGGRPGRVRRFRVGTEVADWPALLDGWLRELTAVSSDGSDGGSDGGSGGGASRAEARGAAAAKRSWRRGRSTDQTAGPGTYDQPGHSGGSPDGSS